MLIEYYQYFLLYFPFFQTFIAAREGWDYNLDEGVNQLVESGRVELVERRVTACYYKDNNGVFYVMKRLK